MFQTKLLSVVRGYIFNIFYEIKIAHCVITIIYSLMSISYFLIMIISTLLFPNRMYEILEIIERLQF